MIAIHYFHHPNYVELSGEVSDGGVSLQLVARIIARAESNNDFGDGQRCAHQAGEEAEHGAVWALIGGAIDTDGCEVVDQLNLMALETYARIPRFGRCSVMISFSIIYIA